MKPKPVPPPAGRTLPEFAVAFCKLLLQQQRIIEAGEAGLAADLQDTLGRAARLFRDALAPTLAHQAGLARELPHPTWMESQRGDSFATVETGRQLWRNAGELEPAAKRRIMAALLYHLRDLFPDGLADELAGALAALDLSETEPLLRPSAAGKRGPAPAELARLKLWAVAHAHFLKGCGEPLEKRAYPKIGEAIGRRGKLVKEWKSELRADFSAELIEQHCEDARSLGASWLAGESLPPMERLELQELMREHDEGAFRIKTARLRTLAPPAQLHVKRTARSRA